MPVQADFGAAAGEAVARRHKKSWRAAGSRKKIELRPGSSSQRQTSRRAKGKAARTRRRGKGFGLIWESVEPGQRHRPTGPRAALNGGCHLSFLSQMREQLFYKQGRVE